MKRILINYCMMNQTLELHKQIIKGREKVFTHSQPPEESKPPMYNANTETMHFDM